jgi:hypothetical protein
MGCLSSGDLKEREEDIHSIMTLVSYNAIVNRNELRQRLPCRGCGRRRPAPGLVKARSVSSDQRRPSINSAQTGARGPSPYTFVLEERGLGPGNEKVLTGIKLGRRTLGTEIAHLTARERFYNLIAHFLSLSRTITVLFEK